jgi:hypothetical protein
MPLVSRSSPKEATKMKIQKQNFEFVQRKAVDLVNWRVSCATDAAEVVTVQPTGTAVDDMRPAGNAKKETRRC